MAKLKQLKEMNNSEKYQLVSKAFSLKKMSVQSMESTLYASVRSYANIDQINEVIELVNNFETVNEAYESIRII